MAVRQHNIMLHCPTPGVGCSVALLLLLLLLPQVDRQPTLQHLWKQGHGERRRAGPIRRGAAAPGGEVRGMQGVGLLKLTVKHWCRAASGGACKGWGSVTVEGEAGGTPLIGRGAATPSREERGVQGVCVEVGWRHGHSQVHKLQRAAWGQRRTGGCAVCEGLSLFGFQGEACVV